MSLPSALTWPYRDYGPAVRKTKGHAPHPTLTWMNRPHCDLCGPFRGRFLRSVGRDAYGEIYRCRGCDDESEA